MKKRHKKKVEELEVEFDVRVIEDLDFKAIRRFLMNYCQKQTFNSAEFVEIICAQPEVGSVIRQLDTEETFGFISVLNIYQHREKGCIKQIKKYVLSVVPKEEKANWEKILESPTLGLLLNERIHNVPHAIAPQLHESVFEEVKSAFNDGLPFKFENYLYITNFGHVDKIGAQQPQEKQLKKKKFKMKQNFYKAEDEIYQKQASMSCTTPITYSETRLFIVFPEEKLPKILNDVKLYVLEGYSW